MNPDIERWNRKYERGNPNPDFAPDPVLAAHREHLSQSGTALDVACGVGHNALFLAGCGYDVVALDGSLVGLRLARRRAEEEGRRLHLAAVDLDRFAPPPDRFDLVVVVRFLDRGLLPRIGRTVRPSGLVFYRTFNERHLERRPGFDPDWVLRPGELPRSFPAFDTVATNEGREDGDATTWWLGRRRAR